MLESQAYAAIRLLPNLIQIIIVIFLLFKQRPRAPNKSFWHKTLSTCIKAFIIACVKDWDRYVCLYGYGNIHPSKHTFLEKSLFTDLLRLILQSKLSTEAYYKITKFCLDICVETGEIVDCFKKKKNFWIAPISMQLKHECFLSANFISINSAS